MDYLRSAATIRPEAAQQALELVDRYRAETDPEKYHQASWAQVRQPYLNAFLYGFALQQAQAAVHLAPDSAKHWGVLGMAQYRLRRYQEALATRTRDERTSQGSPAALAFLAMTQYQLGQKERAQATLARGQDLAQQSEWVKSEEAPRLLHEAELLLAGKPALPPG